MNKTTLFMMLNPVIMLTGLICFIADLHLVGLLLIIPGITIGLVMVIQNQIKINRLYREIAEDLMKTQE